MLASSLTLLDDDLFLVRERKQVLQLTPELQELARRTNQLGAMHWLEYFLETRSRAKKPPYLVLQLRKVGAREISAEDIVAVGLFFEYRVAGVRTRVFSTDDAAGYRTVIAAPEDRDQFAHRAARALLDFGAHIVLTVYQTVGEALSAGLPRGGLVGSRERKVPRMLHLSSTYDETLGRFGHSTRFNLRYYRRRLSQRMQLQYVGDAKSLITAAEFKSLNKSSLNPIGSPHEVALRWNCSCRLPDSFVAGLRSPDGKWLSLIGGWRQDTTTVVHWQLNTAGFEKDSISTVMRSFFLEHEIAAGARDLLIYGGTPHSIQHAFTQDTIVDLLCCRDSLRARIYRWFATNAGERMSLLRSNYLLRTLGELEVRPMDAPGLSTSAQLPDFEPHVL